MVHGLAAQSGGRLVLKSRTGKGTTAEVWLPAVEAQAVTESNPGTEPVANNTGPVIKPLTVLVVDDDALVLQSTAVMLEDLSHRVVQARSGPEALAYLSEGKSVDLVITDQAMPGMTGVELFEAIGAQWPHLPVILATGFAELSPDLAPDLLRLKKPFSQDMLARAVTDSVNRAAAGNILLFRPVSGQVERGSRT
jgi:CheY-like chemotaxis protein